MYVSQKNKNKGNFNRETLNKATFASSYACHVTVFKSFSYFVDMRLSEQTCINITANNVQLESNHPKSVFALDNVVAGRSYE